ncbi:MAG: hypothetical protein KGZ86_00740 [Candidatus Latescibacteria bacterium]|nr:hypothetical protein [Candidatus Latescibacterota bacterium]
MNKYLLILISAGLLLVSCFPMINTFETARTFTAHSSGFGISSSPLYFTNNNGILIWPMTRLIYKYGIMDNLDIGVGTFFSGWIPGLLLNTKYQIFEHDIDGAVFFEGTYYGFNLTHQNRTNRYKILTLRPGFIFGQEAEGRFPFSMNLGIHYYSVSESYANEHMRSSATSLATNLGLPIRFGRNRSLKLMPELGLVIPLFGSTSIQGTDNAFLFEPGNVYGQFGIYLGK